MNLPPIPASCIFNFLCLLPIAMNSSAAGHRAEDGHAHNHNRPFFFQPMPSPHMFTPPVPHFMHPPAFHPYFYPTVEIGGGLYYPMCPMPYPRNYGPQSPINHTNYRRPFFNSPLVARPTFYHSARFRHYPFRKNVTHTEVQTDMETNSDRSKGADMTETVPCKRQTAEKRVPKSSGIETSSVSATVLAQERVSHQGIRGEPDETEDGSAALAAKSGKAAGYSFQKEKIRIECSEGAPSINVWRSFEATVPLYNPAPNTAEDRIQCEVWSVSACEGAVPFYGPFDADKVNPGTAQFPIPGPAQMLLNSKCSEKTPEFQTPPGEGQTSPSKTENLKLPTTPFLHEASRQRSSSEIVHPSGIGADGSRRQGNGHIAERRKVSEYEMSKSDDSLESVEEYVPSANVLVWLQSQARGYRWKNGLPQPIPDGAGILNGSFEEISPKDEESSFDFFDAMPARKQVSYSHLMCDSAAPPARRSDAPPATRLGSRKENRAVSDKFCSACQKPTKSKSEKSVCKTHSAHREHPRKSQLIGNCVGGGRRKCRKISPESSNSNTNHKTGPSSDSEPLSRDQDRNSRAGVPGKVQAPGFSRKKILPRPAKSSTLQLANRSQDKRRGKRTLDPTKQPVHQREQNGAGTECPERQKPGLTANPERKRKEGKRRKCPREALNVQNESEESVDEYWNKVGAKPKSATPSHGDAEHEKKQQKVKAICKPAPLKRSTQEFNEMETWDSSCLHGFQGNALRRGRAKKMLKHSCI
ncbi:uncharacterized protein LOC119972878 isoform X1 [Scyliorhinus canicula]|uniref:uncharacterized protein LOC119972878 isoform X1 n=1 Tax=Scyliorhinus canicula TaxID=7830 RepID=UPI0018F56C1A|nr:uncharacterized protein LOC119972878 isoform X1 [Scyliorhinus canicula]XP_038666342.1 uncharacterized protein LOC119972878 isoform X1 [Scyliorhinus canicula]XP_038666343.1 uncharacterized protein LOC119972878 isoform X1 [Scyliorhinus canicula]